MDKEKILILAQDFMEFCNQQKEGISTSMAKQFQSNNPELKNEDMNKVFIIALSLTKL